MVHSGADVLVRACSFMFVKATSYVLLISVLTSIDASYTRCSVLHSFRCSSKLKVSAMAFRFWKLAHFTIQCFMFLMLSFLYSHVVDPNRSKVSDEAEVPGESRDTRSEPGVAECAIPMEEDVNVKDFVPEILTKDIPHTRVAEENNLEGQPNKTQIGEVILHPEKLLSSKKSQKLQLGEEIALDSMSDEIANGKHASIEEQPRDSNDQRGTGKDVQVGSLPGHISPRYNGATFSSIQLVNRDERSGSRGETNLLSVVTGSRLLPSRGINKEPVVSELEEGEIAPQRQGESSVTAEKGKTITSEVTPSNYPVRMVFPELPVTNTVPQEEEGEFPSSDDHNSFCEECEVGGELM